MEQILAWDMIIYFKILLIALIGALIGWITNKLAIRLIFRPVRPVKIPLLKFSIQGLIPRRRNEIAKRIAEIIDSELVSFREMLEKYVSNENISEIKESIVQGIMHIVGRKIPSFVYTAFENTFENYLQDFFKKEGDVLLRDLIAKYLNEAPGKVKLTEIVEEKINALDMKQFEKMVLAIAGRELKHIEQIGALLGFLIGLVQGLFSLFI